MTHPRSPRSGECRQVKLVEGEAVICDLTQERTHGRRVGYCYRDGQDSAEAVVRAGLARDYPRFSPYRTAGPGDVARWGLA